jgi:hypothetical protein
MSSKAVPCRSAASSGRGPQENYRDRNTGGDVGLYTAQLSEWVTHYVRPQDNSNRTDVRWISFTTAQGRGLRISAKDALLGVTAWPYKMAELETAKHDYELPTAGPITITLDGFSSALAETIAGRYPCTRSIASRARGYINSPSPSLHLGTRSKQPARRSSSEARAVFGYDGPLTS